MLKRYLSFIFVFTFLTTYAQNPITVDCNAGPENINFCYQSDQLEEFTFVSSDGSSINLTVNSGDVEDGWDEFIILDTDGTPLTPPDFYGNGGDLAGLTYQSTGDEITVQVDPDGSIDCQSSANIDPIDITASCATCINPNVDYSLESDCLNAPQYFIDADVTDLGSATSLTVTDDQGSAPQTVNSTGVVTFGPYGNGTDVQLTAQNDQDANCSSTSQVFSQENCTLNLVDCNAGPVNVNFCYESDQLEEFTFVSSDGSSINLTVNSGDVEDGWDEFIILDTDGSPLTPPDFYGNGGDLTGLTYQSTGDEITVQVDPDGSIDCQSDADIDPIDITASCATCANPDVDYSLESDCLNAPQFFVDADVADLGSATSLTITDDQGSAAQTVNSTGVVTFGPYANGTDVQLTAQNDQDVNCSSTSQVFTQEICTENLVDCTAGPTNVNFCYTNDELTELSFTSSDGSSVNLTVNSGDVEDGLDEFIVLDTDGTELFNGYGNAGDLSGLSFQSTGDEITVQVDASFINDCQDSADIDPIDITASCATCVNPVVDYSLESDCLNAPQYFIDADVTDLGSATSLTLTDDQGSAPQTVNSTGIVTFGPYGNGTDVQLTAQNDQDANCSSTSQVFSQENCTLNLVDCNAGPVNVNFCYQSDQLEEFTFVSSDGSSINLSVNSGDVEESFDEFIVLDTDGTELYNGYGNGGDLSGLTFQSTGDEITVQVDPDFSIDCQGSGNIDPIDITASCATCANPDVDYDVIANCTDDTSEFSVDVFVNDLGSASAVEVTTNQGNGPITVNNTPQTITFGPYDLGTDVVVTTENVDDQNCIITSPSLTQQTCGCSGSQPFCAPDEGEALVFPNVDDSSGTEADPTLSNYGCLGTQPNPVWYFLQVEESGELVFEIVQNTQFDDNGNPTGTPLDVDFMAWGPFSETDYCNDLDSCTNCASNTIDNGYPYGNVIDCSYSPDPEETLTIPNAQDGEIYAVLITNFAGDPGFISLGQTNDDDPNSGSTDCTIVTTTFVTACEVDGDVTLNASNDNSQGYQWLEYDEASDSFNPIAGADQSSFDVDETGIYQVQWLDDNLDINTEDFDVTIIPEPEVDDQTVALCNNQSSIDIDAEPENLSDYESIDYQWFNNGNPINGETQSSLTVTQPDDYSVEITTSNTNQDTDETVNCPKTVNFTVTDASFSVDLGGDQTFCDDQPQTITPAIQGEDDTNATYSWNTGEDTASIQVDQSGTYSLTATINGCDVTQSVNYLFSPEPEVDLGSDNSVCENETLTLDATPDNASDYDSIDYQWSQNGNILNGETNAELIVDEPSDYSVEITTTNSNAVGQSQTCVYNFSTNVDGALFSVDLGADQTFCDADFQTITAQLTNADANNADFSWSTGEGTQNIDVSETNIYTVTVTVNGCSVTQSVEYVFDESPDFELGEDVETCDLAPIAIDATPANFDPTMTIFEWSKDGNVLQSEIDAVVNPENYGFGTYEVTAYSDDEDCFTTDQITISKREDISVALSTDDTDNLFCAGEQVNISANLSNASMDEASFEWLVNGEMQNGENNDSFTYQTSEEDGVDTIEVIVSINGDCEVSDSVNLDKYDIDNCTISQGISPNNDGLNDELDLRFLDDRSGIKSLEIFDRYGSSVFKQSNYRNEFSGQNDDGDQLRTGTYFYVIKFEQEDSVYGMNHSGWIYINQEQ